jgi:hypothetical protein
MPSAAMPAPADEATALAQKAPAAPWHYYERNSHFVCTNAACSTNGKPRNVINQTSQSLA